jgi:hypothetical protein
MIAFVLEGRLGQKLGHHGTEHVALPARLHFFLPIFLHFSMTHGPVDKPAQMSQSKFPCRAVGSAFLGATLGRPTFLFFSL